MSCNDFSTFPNEAIISKQLTELDLSKNKVSNFKIHFFDYGSYINFLQICKLPLLPKLQNLVRLNLSNNQIEEFPQTQDGQFPHLRVLDLRSNHIASIPNIGTGMKDLEILNVSKNLIKVIPHHFLASLISLNTIDASRNELGQ